MASTLKYITEEQFEIIGDAPGAEESFPNLQKGQFILVQAKAAYVINILCLNLQDVKTAIQETKWTISQRTYKAKFLGGMVQNTGGRDVHAEMGLSKE